MVNVTNRKPRKTRQKRDSVPVEIEEVTELPPPMTFLPGNHFWEARSTHGRAPIFSNPEDMLDAANQYFRWAAANPLPEEKVFAYQGEITRTTIGKLRAMTIGGLCIFMGISRDAWDDYCKRADFIGITKAIAEVIRDQKFGGAAADLLNANIIARDLGLADKTELSGSVAFTDLADRVKRAKSRK